MFVFSSCTPKSNNLSHCPDKGNHIAQREEETERQCTTLFRNHHRKQIATGENNSSADLRQKNKNSLFDSQITTDEKTYLYKKRMTGKSKSVFRNATSAEKLERHLLERMNVDPDVYFTDRMSFPADETINIENNNNNTIGNGSTMTDAERCSVVMGVQSLSLEELQRRLKVSHDRIRAKSDAFDLIYSQWQKTHNELVLQKEKEEALKARLEIAENRLQEKDHLIGDLQFKLFWAESELEDEKEKKEIEVALMRQKSENRPALTSNIPFGSTGSNMVLNGSSAVIPLRIDQYQKDAENPQNHSPANHKSGINAIAGSSECSVSSLGSQKASKRGFFSGGNYANPDRRYIGDSGDKQTSKRRDLFARALSKRSFPATRTLGPTY